MSTHPLAGLPTDLAYVFFGMVLGAGVLVILGFWLRASDAEWGIDWERVFVALLEVTFGLIFLWKVDQWIKLFTSAGAQ